MTGSEQAELYEKFEDACALAQQAAVIGGDYVMAYMKARSDFRQLLLELTEPSAPLIPLGASL